MLDALKRWYWRKRLKAPEWAHLAEPYDGDELVSIDCETTGLDPKKAEILSVGAILIKGDRIVTSRRLDFLVKPAGGFSEKLIKIHHLRPIDVERGIEINEAMQRVLEFVGPRPLVGYYLEFDKAMLDKYVRPMLGVKLPNRCIEVSALFYDWRAPTAPPGSHIDLRFETIRTTLDLPQQGAHDAFNDALMTAMMYLRLIGGWRPPRPRE